MKNKELKKLIRRANELRNELHPPVLLPSGTKAEIKRRWGSITKAAKAADLDVRTLYRHLQTGRAPNRYFQKYYFILNNDIQSKPESNHDKTEDSTH